MNQEEETNKSVKTNQSNHIFKSENLTQLNEQLDTGELTTLRRRLIRCIFEKSLISTGYHLTLAALINNPELKQTYEAYVSKLKETHGKVFTQYVFYKIDSQGEPNRTQIDDLARNGFQSTGAGITFCKYLDIALLHEYANMKSHVYFVLAKVTHFKSFEFFILNFSKYLSF